MLFCNDKSFFCTLCMQDLGDNLFQILTTSHLGMCDKLKVFLSTACDHEKIRIAATTPGIDRVVIKISDAREIVSLVASELL
ncbi:MAG: hypothetical protein ACI8ZB_001020 [Desulforhopalus sp.]|jgi:hypothetical protein